MNNLYKYKIDKVVWGELSIFAQMGNIYSEVGRAFNTRDDIDSYNHLLAVSRAIDLFNITAQGLVYKKPYRAREVMRSKEEFLKVVFDKFATLDSIDSLNRYFMQFAIAARLNK